MIISENCYYMKLEFFKDEVEVVEGRYLVVEKVMDSQEYVLNNCMMGDNR